MAKNADITQIVIHENSVATPDYFDNMEYSLDGITWMPAEIVSYTPKSATLGGKAGRERVYTLTPFAARSVRVTTPETPTKSSIGIYEFEVWGEYVGGFDARLSSLVPSFGELIPAFDPDVREYDITIESTEGGMPVMRAAAQDEEATVTVTDATEQSMQAVIDVTSANGEVNSQYVVTIISMSKNTELSKLELSGGALSESFDPERTAYTCVVGEHDPLPSVVAEPLVSGAKVEVRQADEDSMEAQVTVTSADGTQSRTYTVSFVRTGARLEAIYLNGIRMEEFSPDRLHYTFYYFIEDDLPDITFDKMYENASAELTQPTANQSLIRVTSLADEVREYTISFIKRSRAMDDASLCAVTIEGKLIDGFRPDQYEYLIYVESGLDTP